jgi:Fur family ferric uptake transcriptional regulator
MAMILMILMIIMTIMMVMALGADMNTRIIRMKTAGLPGMDIAFRWRGAENMTMNNVSTQDAMNHYQKQFRALMEERGRHVTRQRLSVAGLFYEMRGHPTTNELHDELRKKESSVGLATVYRTLRLLKDVGLAMELRGNEGSARFEAVSASKRHDHLVCRKCGAVLEICSQELEQAQSELAREYDFFPDEEARCIYGLCFACHDMELRRF